MKPRLCPVCNVFNEESNQTCNTCKANLTYDFFTIEMPNSGPVPVIVPDVCASCGSTLNLTTIQLSKTHVWEDFNKKHYETVIWPIRLCEECAQLKALSDQAEKAEKAKGKLACIVPLGVLFGFPFLCAISSGFLKLTWPDDPNGGFIYTLMGISVFLAVMAWIYLIFNKRDSAEKSAAAIQQYVSECKHPYNPVVLEYSVVSFHLEVHNPEYSELLLAGNSAVLKPAKS